MEGNQLFIVFYHVSLGAQAKKGSALLSRIREKSVHNGVCQLTLKE